MCDRDTAITLACRVCRFGLCVTAVSWRHGVYVLELNGDRDLAFEVTETEAQFDDRALEGLVESKLGVTA